MRCRSKAVERNETTLGANVHEAQKPAQSYLQLNQTVSLRFATAVVSLFVSLVNKVNMYTGVRTRVIKGKELVSKVIIPTAQSHYFFSGKTYYV